MTTDNVNGVRQKTESPCRPCSRDTCKYYDNTIPACIYILITGKRRPCQGGSNCSAYEREEEKQEGMAYKVKEGHGRSFSREETDQLINMYLSGSSSQEIGDAIGRKRNVVNQKLYQLRKKGVIGSRSDTSPASAETQQPETVHKKISTALKPSPDEDLCHSQAWEFLCRQIDAERDRLKALCGDRDIEVRGREGYYIYLAGQRAALNRLKDEAYALAQLFELGGE